MKRLITVVINIFLILIIVFSVSKIYTKIVNDKVAEKVYEEVRNINNQVNQANNGGTESVENNEEKEKALTEINKDFAFWLKVDNTVIDYPVVQGVDNDYYLKNDFYHNQSFSGTLFVDYRNDYTKDKNVVIYGHNMINKTMFQNIQKFRDEAFFNSNNKIRIYRGDKEYIYEVFSVYTIDGASETIKLEFSDDTDYELYLKQVQNQSFYKAENPVVSSDIIITLYTCSYEFDDARTVIHARLVN